MGSKENNLIWAQKKEGVADLINKEVLVDLRDVASPNLKTMLVNNKLMEIPNEDQLSHLYKKAYQLIESRNLHRPLRDLMMLI